MKLHENYLNPGLLTDSGFNRLSRCQANMQESDQSSVEPTVNGQPRLMAISGERLPGIERGLANDSVTGGPELETYAWNPGSLNLYPDFNPAGFFHRQDHTEVRMRNAVLETRAVRAELMLPYTERITKFSDGEIVEMLPCSTLKQCIREIFNLTCRISKKSYLAYSITKIFERWQKTVGLKRQHHPSERWQKTYGLNRLNHSLIKLGLFFGTEDSLSNNSQLFVC